MSRISRHQMFMDIAHSVAKRATCARLGVGAVAVLGKNIVGYGYNGPPPGEAHCTPKLCAVDGGCSRSTHAEENAIWKIQPGLRFAKKVMYITDAPCLGCAELMYEHSFSEVYFVHPYRLRDGIDYLTARDVKVFRMTHSGYVVNSVTGEFCDLSEASAS